MPLIKSRSKKAMSKNIETEMEAGKPQKQSVAIAYSMMKRARKNKMAKGGLAGTNLEEDQKSLQEHMDSTPNDKEDRGLTLFDGEAERIDPLKKEYRADSSSDHLGREDLEESDKDADDIVSRIMRKMRRK